MLEKPRFGAFHVTDLELILRSRGIDSVTMNVVDSVEIRLHPRNLTRVLRDARERGAKVIWLDAGWTIDGLRVVEDPYVDAGDRYAVSFSGGDFWR